MRKPNAFRPLVLDSLEERVVPSKLGMPSAATAASHQAPLSTQALVTTKVGAAYNDFVSNFTEAVNFDLYTPSVSGYGGNTSLFSQQLGQSLATLEKGVVKALGPSSAGTPVVAQVRKSIIGPGAISLRSRLSALTMSSMTLGSALSSYEITAVQEIRQNFARVKKEVVASLPSSPAATSPTAT